ncbi:MAG TPA: hypothetical protein VIM92_12155, partial [Rhodanobacteraceae bacterium]
MTQPDGSDIASQPLERDPRCPPISMSAATVPNAIAASFLRTAGLRLEELHRELSRGLPRAAHPFGIEPDAGLPRLRGRNRALALVAT